jgi:hypothetical protein
MVNIVTCYVMFIFFIHVLFIWLLFRAQVISPRSGQPMCFVHFVSLCIIEKGNFFILCE